MIVVTGAAGFIGSCLVGKLNNKGITEIVVVDKFSDPEKNKNLHNKVYKEQVDRDDFFEWIEKNRRKIEFIFHIGARTDTAEFNMDVLNELNLNYTKTLWNSCSRFRLPMVYASSAATYGMGEHGYSDDASLVDELEPLNPYGISKNEFDKWALRQEIQPPYWNGMKFFNVYGPNEYHKGRMASVILHAYKQINETGKVKLFKSHRPDFEDGQQLRDFIYVKDVIDALYFMMLRKPGTGLYNLGTGKARSFLDLAKATFRAMGITEQIEFIDTPKDIRDKYQYFTEAKMGKLINSGYYFHFYSLEEGIQEYVQEFLMEERYF